MKKVRDLKKIKQKNEIIIKTRYAQPWTYRAFHVS